MTSLSDSKLREHVRRLEQVQQSFASRYPGERGTRQPVHTVYGGAHLFRSDTTRKLGDLAIKALDQYAPEPRTFAEAIRLPPGLAETVHGRVRKKLEREAVEDFRIDFEDGYGIRPDAEEDGHARTAGEECAKGLAEGTLPPFIGIRIKTFSAEQGGRALRTLDLFLSALVERAGKLPVGFVVTLPKVVSPEQVSVLIDAFDQLEPELGLPRGALKMEPMIETTQSILDERGESTLPKLLTAARGRCVAAHFGTYDYTASCDITAMFQSMRHPACDFAKHMMKVAYAGTGIWLSDGATTLMPVAPHKAAKGAQLTAEQARENQRAVHRALVNGYYQGWDLHPAQLPSRYGAVYGFFLEGLPAASERLKNFIAKAAQATLAGDVFDDAATGQGLLNYFLRGVHSGALSEEEAVRRSGLSVAELRGRSFVAILAARGRG